MRAAPSTPPSQAQVAPLRPARRRTAAPSSTRRSSPTSGEEAGCAPWRFLQKMGCTSQDPTGREGATSRVTDPLQLHVSQLALGMLAALTGSPVHLLACTLRSRLHAGA